MTESLSLDDALGELPLVADQAVSAVLDLYAAVRQAKALGASYTELSSLSGLPRSTVQDVVAGKFPRFAVG